MTLESLTSTTLNAEGAGTEPILLRRVWSEFHEMPGMALTVAQAARLFGIPEAACETVMALLEQQGMLARRGDGRFAQIGTERAGRPGRDARHPSA